MIQEKIPVLWSPIGFAPRLLGKFLFPLLLVFILLILSQRNVFPQSFSKFPPPTVAYEPSGPRPQSLQLSENVEFFGNYHTAGLILSLPGEIPLDRVRRVTADLDVAGAWTPVHDLVQIGNSNRFATSLFWLKPGQTYRARIQIIDPALQTIQTLFGEGTTRPDPHIINSEQHSYYLATTGNDVHPGTKDRPFRTFSHALKILKPGDALLIRGGTYYEGQLEFAHSGRVDAPIMLQAVPGERVILDGSDPRLMNSKSWRRTSNNCYQHPYSFRSAHACLKDKVSGEVIRLFPVTTLAELQARSLQKSTECQAGGAFDKNGIRGALFTDGTQIHLALPKPVDQYEVLVPQWNRALILTDRQHIQIEGLDFRHYGREEHNTAIFLGNTSDILIQKCNFQFNDSYIYVKARSDRITIQDCTFQDDLLSWPFGYMKCSSSISGHFEGGALNVDASFSGRGLVFRRNQIDGLFDGAHLTPYRLNEATTNEIDFYQNSVTNSVDDFLEADGFSRNVRIFDNVMNRSLSGISLAQALDGPTFVLYNVLGNCGDVPAASREQNFGYPFKTNGGPQAEIGSGQIFLYHNVAHTSDPHSRALLVKQAIWKKITLRNNIWCGQEAGFDLWPKLPSPLDWDFDNIFIANRSAPLVIQSYRTKFKTLKEVQDNLGWLKHGLNTDPVFSNPSVGDYSLRASSPCIDAGQSIPGINDLRMRGNRPDLGPYENR